MSNRKAGIPGLLLFLAFGVVVAGFGGYLYLEQEEKLTTYEPVDATVELATLERDSEGNIGPEIEYEYSVGGQTYRSSNIFSSGSVGGRFRSEEIVADYPAGTTVTAYYDPDDPSKAYLVEKRTIAPILVIGLGGFSILGAVLGLLQRLLGFAE